MGWITIINGVNRGDHHITNFKMSAKSEGSWVNLENVEVTEAPDAVIGSDGRISLSEGLERLDLNFDQIHKVSDVKLTVFETDTDDNNGVITELLVPSCK